MFLSLGITVVQFLRIYGSDFSIKFITTDPAVHYLFSKHFSEGGKLLLFSNPFTPYNHMSSYPFLNYSNTGLIMALSNSEEGKVAVYLLSNFFYYFLTILLVYVIYRNLVKSNSLVISTIVILAVSLGYNLNGVIFGFSSQMAGVVMVLSLVVLKNNFIKSRIKTLLISLVMVGLFFAYYYYIPAAILSIFLSDFLKGEHSNIKQRIKGAFNFENVIPTCMAILFGFFYLIVLNPINDNGNVDSLASEGYIFRELYTDFKPYILFVLVALFAWYKDKKNNILYSAFISYSLFALFILVMGMVGKASSYYYFKNYYLLESFLIILFGVGLYLAKQKYKPIYFAYIAGSLILLIMTLYGDKWIQSRNELFNANPSINITAVQKFNIEIIPNTQVTFDKNQRQFMDYIVHNKSEFVDKQNHIPVIGGLLQKLWFYSYTEIWPKYDQYSLLSLYEEPSLDYKMWTEDVEKKPYIIVFEPDSNIWFENQGVDLKDFEVVYEQEGAKLLKLKE